MPHKAICFVIMPFGTKPDASGRTIDFNSIYSGIIKPAVEQTGFDPMRADEEMDAGFIHKAMYERLLLSEYAIADLSIFNPNVYYELGVRHAARPQTTALIAAVGSQLPFDLAHLRTLHYKLDDKGTPLDADADRARLAERLDHCKRHDETDSPLFKLLQNYRPPEIEHLKHEFQREAANSLKLKERLREAKEAKEGVVAALDAVWNDLGDAGALEAGVAVDLLKAYRSAGAWDKMIELSRNMDPVLRRTLFARQQYAFALNRAGRGDDAEREFLALIEERGPDSETCGMLGRVYKDRWTAAKKADDIEASEWAEKAIEAYLRGFEADWRDFYPGVNAVTLIALNNPQDPRIGRLAPVVRYAVERKIARGGDYWAFATQLELAVIADDLGEARKILPKAVAALRDEPGNAKTTVDTLGHIRAAWTDCGKDIEQLDKIIAHLASKVPK